MNIINKNILVITDGVLALIFGFMTGFIINFSVEGTTLFMSVSLGILTVGCIILVLKKLKPLDPVVVMLLCSFAAAAIFIRGCMFYYASTDYNNFLAEWISKMRELGGLKPLTEKIGDYNMPYLYFLFMVSKFPVEYELVFIKLFSLIFDVICAYYMMKLISLKTDNMNIKAFTFFGTLMIPTVILNGSYWGQCDSIYTAFVIASLYYALLDKSKLSVIMTAIAVSFKIQTIFFIPAFIVFVVAGKIKIKDLWLLPSVFAAFLVPAIAAGRSVIDSVSIYFEQVGQYRQLTLNAPSIYALVGESVSFEHFDIAAVIMAAMGIGAIFYFCYINRSKINIQDYIYIVFLFSLTVPFLLPRMHDRYFFVADILSFMIFLYNRKRWYVPVICVLASYNSYYYFVMGSKYIMELKYFSLAYVFVIIMCVKDLYDSIQENKKINEI